MNYTINGTTKIITPTDAPVGGAIDVDVQDLYSRWVDWMLTSDNSKFDQAMRVVGGDPLPGSKQLGITYFLLNGWKIKPYEADHIFTLDGNLYSEDGTSPYMATTGAYNVTIINSVSNLVDSTVQQLPEIENSVYQGGVTIDTINGTNGTAYPIGTPGMPCLTVANALAISQERGFNTLYVKGDVTLSTDDFPTYDGGRIVGYGHRQSNVTIDGVVFTRTMFEECHIDGVFGDGSNVSFNNCTLMNTENLIYDAHFCGLMGTLKFSTQHNTSYFIDCFTVDDNGATAYLDLVDSPDHISMQRFSGKIEILNMNNVISSISTINAVGGKITVASSCTTGTLKVRGICELVDNSNGTIVDKDNISVDSFLTEDNFIALN
jgi:hypothetical protein